MRSTPRSLTAKFLVVYLATVITTIALLFSLLEYRSYQEQVSGLNRRLNEVADLRSGPLTKALWDFDTEILHLDRASSNAPPRAFIPPPDFTHSWALPT